MKENVLAAQRTLGVTAVMIARFLANGHSALYPVGHVRLSVASGACGDKLGVSTTLLAPNLSDQITAMRKEGCQQHRIMMHC